jgi:hypothetical protein
MWQICWKYKLVCYSLLESSMPVPDGLADLERRAWQSTFDDGLFDMLLGTMLLLNWLGTIVPHNRLLYPFFFALAGAYVVVKRLVILPRAGVVRFAAPRRQRKLLSMGLLLMPLLLGVVTVLVGSTNDAAADWLRAHPVVFQAAFPIMVLLVFSGLALLLEVPRIHVIGAVMALAFGLDIWRDSAMGFLVGGVLVCLLGIVLFTRFLRRYPPLTPEERQHAR